MKSFLFLLFLPATGLPTRTLAQQAPAATDLRRLADAMQEAAKPGVTQEQQQLAAIRASPPPAPATSGPVRLVSISTLPSMPLPVLLNNRRVPFDSLNRYTMAQVETVMLDTNPHYNALFGGVGSWGVIKVQLKPAAGATTKK